MSAANHTTTPWKVLNWVIFDANEKPVTELAGEYKGSGNLQIDANAEFIVTACNAHEELVKAGQAVLKDLRGWVACVARSNGFNHEATRNAENRLSALKEALAKAGVK